MVFFNCELTYQHVVSPLFASSFAPACFTQSKLQSGNSSLEDGANVVRDASSRPAVRGASKSSAASV
jgi:hypothetical protein